MLIWLLCMLSLNLKHASFWIINIINNNKFYNIKNLTWDYILINSIQIYRIIVNKNLKKYLKF